MELITENQKHRLISAWYLLHLLIETKTTCCKEKHLTETHNCLQRSLKTRFTLVGAVLLETLQKQKVWLETRSSIRLLNLTWPKAKCIEGKCQVSVHGRQCPSVFMHDLHYVWKNVSQRFFCCPRCVAFWLDLKLTVMFMKEVPVFRNEMDCQESLWNFHEILRAVFGNVHIRVLVFTEGGGEEKHQSSCQLWT